MEKLKTNCLWKSLAVFSILAALFFFAPSVSAHQAGETVTSDWGYTAGTYNDKGQIVFNVCTENYRGQTPAHINSNALTALCNNDEKKTIVIPSGSTVELMNVIRVGNNTTIIADGATLVMTEKSKGVICNDPRKTNYNSVKNVYIKGGTWKVNDTKNGYTVMRFCHGSNVTIENATIIGDYQSHEIELIAMKNVTVKNCTLKVRGKKDKNSVEEALQIDIATPKTAPGVANFGSKYVKGQTCKNIKILNNKIEGSRGLCVNAALSSGEEKYKNNFHDNITIIGNTMIGQSAEGCTIYNTKNAVVKNNVIKTFSSRKTQSYGVGLNITIQGKTSKKAMKKAKITIQGNTVYGYRQGIQVITMTSTKYASVKVKKNKCYASKKANAIYLQSKAAKKIKSSGNKYHKR